MLANKFCLETVNGELRLIISDYLNNSGLSRLGLIDNMKRRGIPASRKIFDRIMHERKYLPDSLTLAKILGYCYKSVAIDETVDRCDGELGQYLRHEIPMGRNNRRSDNFIQSQVQLANELNTFEKYLVFCLSSAESGVSLEFLKDSMIWVDPLFVINGLVEKKIISEVMPSHWHCNIKDVNLPDEFVRRYLPEMRRFFKMNSGKFAEFRKLYFYMNSTSEQGLKELVDLSFNYEKKKKKIIERNKGNLPVFSYNIVETAIPEKIASKYLNHS